MRRAKIIATLGPSSSTEAIIERLLIAGADLIRLNLSHGSHRSHRDLVIRVRGCAERLQTHIPIIFDLMGPRYRIGEIGEGVRTISRRQRVRLGTAQNDPDIPIDDAHLLQHLKKGERVLIDNGLIELKIVETDGDEIVARVVHGGEISSRKGVNLPDSELPFEISDKDRADIELAVELGIDFIAASYVGQAKDVDAVRRQIHSLGGHIPIVAKLERGRALDHVDEIADHAEAIMVARGDLGVEVQLHRVPVLQKQIIETGLRSGTPVIVATQMLDSMISQPRPTRAETSDVANAVFDGADALLLTGETAAGDYPVRAIQTMAKIVCEAEAYRLTTRSAAGSGLNRHRGELPPLKIKARGRAPGSAGRAESEIADAVARAAVLTVRHLGVRQIVAFSQSGFTARLISRYRPDVSILAFTPDPEVARSVQMYWGVRPILIDERVESSADIMALVERYLVDKSLAKGGEKLIILMAEPLQERALTNLMRVHRVQPH